MSKVVPLTSLYLRHTWRHTTSPCYRSRRPVTGVLPSDCGHITQNTISSCWGYSNKFRFWLKVWKYRINNAKPRRFTSCFLSKAVWGCQREHWYLLNTVTFSRIKFGVDYTGWSMNAIISALTKSIDILSYILFCAISSIILCHNFPYYPRCFAAAYCINTTW